MVIKTYSITLEEDLVDRAKKIASKYGGKLSPILNRLLEEWCDKETKKSGGSQS